MLSRLAAAAGSALVLVACGARVVEAGNEIEAPEGVVVVPAPTAPASVPASTPVTAEAVAFDVGACVAWDQASTTATFRVVPCEESHLVELAGPVDLAGSVGPDAPYPTPERLAELTSGPCSSVVDRYLGGASRDGVTGGIIPPSESSWAAGSRQLWCTVGLARQDGKRPAYTGRLTDRV